MPSWQHSVEIEASSAQVWEVMSGIGTWPQWTSSILAVELPTGPLEVGSEARVHARGTPPSRWKVTGWRPGEGFTWVARVRGAKTIGGHEIQPAGDGRSRVTLSITVPGILGSLFKRAISHTIVEDLRLEAEGLKARSEAVLPS